MKNKIPMARPPQEPIPEMLGTPSKPWWLPIIPVIVVYLLGISGMILMAVTR